MSSISASDLFKRSLSILGVFGEGESLESYQGEQARVSFNNMLERWNLQGLIVYNHYTTTFDLVPGKQVYSVGLGGDINIERPALIDKMYMRYNNVDYPIREITYEQYADLSLKSISLELPRNFYYESSFPLANLRLAQMPTITHTVYMVVPQNFNKVTALSDTINYPDGYGRALETNLAVELSVFYPNTLRQELISIAKESKDDLLKLNIMRQLRPASFEQAILKDRSAYANYPWILW